MQWFAMARDLLNIGLSTLSSKLKTHASATVTYQRGEDSVQVSATRGRTAYTVHDESGVEVGSGVVDFLIAAEDLVIDDAVITPKIGDKIVASDATFTVLALPGDGCWRNSDPFGINLRIHTKEL